MTTTLLSLCLLPCLMIAQGQSTGYTYLRMPMTARSAALAESDVAHRTFQASWTSNPALLVESKFVAVSLSHLQWIQDVQTEHFAAVIPFSFASIGFSISSTATRNIEVRDQPGPPLGTFNARGTSFRASAGIPFDNDIHLGFSAKYIFEKLYVDESAGFGIDVGVLAQTPLEGLSAGMTLTDLGASNRMRNQSTSLPTTFRGGLAYIVTAGDVGVTSSASFSHLLHGGSKHLHLGIEGRYDIVSLRAGFQSGYDSRGWSLGFGAVESMVSFDYAFLPFSLGLGSAHFATLTFQF